MNPNKPPQGSQRTHREPVELSEIRFSAEVIAAAEKSAGRKLRSDVPVLPPERQRQDG